MTYIDLNINELRQMTLSPEATLAGLRNAIRGVYASGPLAQVANVDRAALDSITALSIRNVEQVLPTMLETIYPPLKAEMVVPMSTEGVNPFAAEFVYERMTEHGLADYIVNGEMPRADISADETRVKVRAIGAEVGWDFFELEQARTGGKPLDQMKYQAQERAVRTSRNLIMLSGDSGLPKGGGLINTGFVNDANVPAVSTTTGAWSGLTGAQIISDMMGYRNTYNAQVKQAFAPDTLALPGNRRQYLLQPISAGSEMTIERYLLTNFPGLTRIEELDELNTANSGGTRAVLYRRAPDVVVGVIPMGFRMFNPQQKGLQVMVQAAERLAGCFWKFPLGGLYINGI